MRRADTSDLKWYDEGGFNVSRIMTEAHMLASTNAEFGRADYAEYLSEALQQQWEMAKESRDAVKRAGGPDAVRDKEERRQQKKKQNEAKKAAEKYGNKKRRLVLYDDRKAAKDALDGDQVFDGFGKTWRADADTPSLHGSQWLGYEGRKVCYMYYYKVDDAALDEMAAA